MARGVNLAWKSLWHDKLRFLITVSGVAFAVTLVFVQVGLFSGLLDNSTITIDHIDADLWVTSRNTPNVDFAHGFAESTVDRVRSIPGVERADNLIVTFMNLALPSGAEEGALVYALEDFRKWRLPWDVQEGDPTDLRRGPYLFMDDSSERRYGPFAVGDYREVQGRRMKIIGRTREAKSFTTTPILFMDYARAQELSPLLAGRTTYVLVKVADAQMRDSVMAEIKKRLPYNDVYPSAEWAARSRSYWVVNTGIGFNMFMTVFLGCLVGVVVVAQTLYTSTMEHLKEFGTVKAIGGSNRDIYAILLQQAGISALVGFVLGVIPSLALRPAIAAAGLKMTLPGSLLVSVFVGTIVLCLGASMISFRKVASIDPALVFRG